ncbi:restriction endonuclease subunit S [Mycobacterium fragae]|nr:restriction endonuclease subunit S [Mycobacterium fragae]MCV7401288.1 restriction endonuclease subunit S [Mycobacterium fragae]
MAEVKHTHQVTLGKMLRTEAGDPGDVLLPYLRAAHIPPTGFTLDDPKKMWFTRDEASALTLKKGDVVVVEGGMGGYGRCDIVPEDLPGWGFQNSINRLRPKNGNCGTYTKYLLQIARERGFIDVLCSVSTMPHLTAEKLGAIRLPLPRTDEQWAIAGFLDHETEKIDALIGKQEQLIATLREDRTATISHAVTKGLDPDVAMVDSGVEWLGEIPCQWTALRIKNVIRSVEAGTSVNAAPWPAEPEAIGVLKTSCVSAGWFNCAENKAVVDDDEIGRVTCPVRADSLIVNRANTPLLVGSVGYVTSDLKNIYLSDKLWQVRFGGALARFIYYWAQTERYRSQIAALCVGASSSMQNLAMADFRNIALALPPLDEQAEIVRFLADRTNKIDKLIAKSNKVIEALKEYRSALITDAITGKIDAREAVA